MYDLFDEPTTKKSPLPGIRSHKTNPLEDAVRNFDTKKLPLIIRQMKKQGIYRSHFFNMQTCAQLNACGRVPSHYCFRKTFSLVPAEGPDDEDDSDDDEQEEDQQPLGDNEQSAASPGMQCLQIFIDEERRVDGDEGEWFVWEMLMDQSDGKHSRGQLWSWNFLHDACRFNQVEMVKYSFSRILHLIYTLKNRDSRWQLERLRKMSTMLLQQNMFHSMPIHVALIGKNEYLACYLLLKHLQILCMFDNNVLLCGHLTHLLLRRNDRQHTLLRTCLSRNLNCFLELLLALFDQVLTNGTLDLQKLCKKLASSMSTDPLLAKVAEDFLEEVSTASINLLRKLPPERSFVTGWTIPASAMDTSLLVTDAVPAFNEAALDFRNGLPSGLVLRDNIELRDIAEATLIHHFTSKRYDKSLPWLQRLCKIKGAQDKVEKSIVRCCMWQDMGGNQPLRYAALAESPLLLGFLVELLVKHSGRDVALQQLIIQSRINRISTIDAMLEWCQKKNLTFEALVDQCSESETTRQLFQQAQETNAEQIQGQPAKKKLIKASENE